MRLHVKHYTTKSPRHSSITDMMNMEYEAGMTRLETYTEFSKMKGIHAIATDTMRFLWEQFGAKKIVVGAGAAAKGNTFLNYCHIDQKLIQCITDNTEFKQGKFTPGSHIPIYSEDVLKEIKPDYVLVLPWNHFSEITKNLSFVKKWGGQFVRCIPELEVI